jgi:hypothetical protein
MSPSGQSRRFAPPLTTSGLPPTADITHRDYHFRKVPLPDIVPSRVWSELLAPSKGVEFLLGQDVVPICIDQSEDALNGSIELFARN